MDIKFNYNIEQQSGLVKLYRFIAIKMHISKPSSFVHWLNAVFFCTCSVSKYVFYDIDLHSTLNHRYLGLKCLSNAM